MKISVAMAYYNGKKYIEQQLDSILAQLGEEDEVVISIDSAEDGSGGLLKRLAQKDHRIILLKGPGKGVVRNFSNAMSHCGKDVIFVADQDDIWTADKVRTVMRIFEQSPVSAVLHNALLVDENGDEIDSPSLFDLRKSRAGIWKNLIKNSYVGCCMAFRRELLAVILPIPRQMYMHDYWIGTAAEMTGGVALIKEPLLFYRRHGANVTDLRHGTLLFMIKKRADMLRSLRILRRRVKEKEKNEHK